MVFYEVSGGINSNDVSLYKAVITIFITVGDKKIVLKREIKSYGSCTSALAKGSVSK